MRTFVVSKVFLKGWLFQTRRKQFRVGLAKIGLSGESASILEASGGTLPREILKFSFSKIYIGRILREN